MNVYKAICTKWSAEDLKKWSSLRKTSYILLPMLIYFVVHDLAEILLWALMELVVNNSPKTVLQFIEKQSATLQGVINGLAIVLGVVVIWAAVSNEISIKEPSKKETKNAQTVKGYLVLGILAISAAIGMNILLDLLRLIQRSEVYSQVVMQQYGVSFWIGLVLYGVFSPFVEEALFRGLLFNRMKRCFGYPIALLASAVLFGCYHGNIVQAIYGTILGLMIAYVYEKYKSFAAPVLFHSVANISIFTLSYGNRQRNLTHGMEAVIGAVALAIAVGCLLLIGRKIKKEG